MKKQWQSLVLLISAWVALAAPASAIPVVATGTTYTVYVAGTESRDDAFGRFRFDDVQEFIERANSRIYVAETETEIDATSSRISITLSSDRDLFPDPVDFALLGIGTGGDGLDLLFPVRLTDARMYFHTAANELIAETGNLATEAIRNDPWDGLFPQAEELLGMSDIGARNVQNVRFEFIVSTEPAAVPEPGILMLGGIGLLGLVAARRRKGQA